MENLKTLVYNNTTLPLILKADLKEIVVGAGETKTIQFADLLKEKEKIHVLKDERILQVLNCHDFPDEKKELLVFQMLDGRLQHTFLHWTWSKHIHTKMEVLLQRQCRTGELKTRVDNKTELWLRFRAFYKTPEGVKSGGLKVFDVGPKTRTTIHSGVFFEEGWKHKVAQEIYVMSGDHVVLVMSSDDFQNNKGKDLILDSQHNRFGFAFLQPQPSRWKNWLCRWKDWLDFSKTSPSHLKVQ